MRLQLYIVCTKPNASGREMVVLGVKRSRPSVPRPVVPRANFLACDIIDDHYTAYMFACLHMLGP
jgi:hypothetical protein